MSGEEALVPELRFPKFEGAWENFLLGDIAKFSKGKGISKADIIKGGKTPCIRYGELYTAYGTEICKPISATNVPVKELHLSQGGEVIIPASGEDAKDIATAASVLSSGVALGGDLNVIRGDFSPKFLANLLAGKKRLTLAALAQGNSVVHLYPAQLSSLRIVLPSKNEQRKIASFLDAVSRKITLLTKKKAALEDYKRGVMQRLFSRELRFRRDDGGEFPEWEEMPLRSVFEEVRDKVGQQDIPTYSISAGKGFVSQAKKFGKDISGQQNERYTVLSKGEFAYNKGNSKSYQYGCIYPNETGQKVAVPNVFISFRRRDGSNVVGFFAKLFENHHLDRGLRRIISSGARMDGLLNINKDYFFDLTVPVPHPDEQRKIADFLSALDAKIDTVSAQISETETFKKGLLQKMFV